jgi:hypothetical protein
MGDKSYKAILSFAGDQVIDFWPSREERDQFLILIVNTGPTPDDDRAWGTAFGPLSYPMRNILIPRGEAEA